MRATQRACVRISCRSHRPIQAKNVDGETAIFYPVRNVNPEMVRLLCEFGANVNAASYSKDTPLKGACRANNIQIVNALLDWRATRRPSAFDMLKGHAKLEIDRRLEIERKEKQAEAEAAQASKGGRRGAKWASKKSECVARDVVAAPPLAVSSLVVTGTHTCAA